MAIRLIISITAAPGKGSELGRLYKARCEDIMKEPGCEQFEVFQSVLNSDHLTLLERWTDQAALDVHHKANAARPSLPAELRVGTTEREDYVYNRTR
jgi:quinol monooxygenase YgiN